MTSRTGAQLLVDQLLVHGVERIYCVPGESYLAVLDALYDVPDRIRLIVNRHESGSTNMADADGKLTGKPGIAFVTRAPGACNASIGVHNAFQDSTPLILFIGQVGNDFVEREAFQEVDYRRMFGQMAKWVAQIDRADRVPEYVARAFATATSGRPGPVVLALPEDMLVACADVPDAKPYQAIQASPSADDVATLAQMIAKSSKPLVIAGGPGWDAGSVANLQVFSERFAVPVACAFRFQDTFDNRHPHYVGDVGIGINPTLAKAVRESDCVIAFGPRLGEMTTTGYTLFDVPVPKQPLVHILQDANELGRVYQPTLAINAGMKAMASALAALPAPSGSLDARRATIAALRESYERWQDEPKLFKDRPESLNLWRVMRTLEEKLPEDFILANGAGNFASWGHRFHRYPCASQRSFRTQLAPTSGSMGYGVPAGIAGKIVDPSRTVLVVAGDGDFLMTGQELATAVQEKAPVLFVVIDNGLYGTIRMHQFKNYPGRVSGTRIANPDFAALAKSYGAFGEWVETTDAFAPALDRALAAMRDDGVPALLALKADPKVITPGMVLDD